MSKNNTPKIDNFYFVFIVILGLTAALVIFVFQNVFSNISLSNEIESTVTDKELKINKDQLQQAYDKYFNNETVKLDIR